jgi:hypothetical protein
MAKQTGVARDRLQRDGYRHRDKDRGIYRAPLELKGVARGRLHRDTILNGEKVNVEPILGCIAV